MLATLIALLVMVGVNLYLEIAHPEDQPTVSRAILRALILVAVGIAIYQAM